MLCGVYSKEEGNKMRFPRTTDETRALASFRAREVTARPATDNAIIISRLTVKVPSGSSRQTLVTALRTERMNFRNDNARFRALQRAPALVSPQQLRGWDPRSFRGT